MDAAQAHADMSVPLPAGPPMFRLADPEESKRTLLAAGFSDPEASEIPVSLRCSEPGRVLDVIYKSIVRTRALLEAQSPAVKEKVDRAILEGAERHRRGGRDRPHHPRDDGLGEKAMSGAGRNFLKGGTRP